MITAVFLFSFASVGLLLPAEARGGRGIPIGAAARWKLEPVTANEGKWVTLPLPEAALKRGGLWRLAPGAELKLARLLPLAEALLIDMFIIFN